MNREDKKYLSVLFLISLMVMLSASYAQAETKALFIGTSKFKNANDLPSCEDDAKDMKKAMLQEGLISKETELLLGPNRKSIIKYKVEKAAKSLKEGDTLIIFNSSHGSKGKGIVTWDDYISGRELSQWIAESKCSRVLLINDSCYSGNLRLDIPDKKVCQINSSSPPMVSFTSGVIPKHGHQNSVFTKYVIGALNPDNSDSDGDGNVSANEILEYVKKKMLFEESLKMEDYDTGIYKTLKEAKEAMETAYNNYFKAKEKGEIGWMYICANEYRKAKRIYEAKVGRVEMRWQLPTIIGDPNFIVVGKAEVDLYGGVYQWEIWTGWQMTMKINLDTGIVSGRIHIEATPQSFSLSGNMDLETREISGSIIFVYDTIFISGNLDANCTSASGTMAGTGSGWEIGEFDWRVDIDESLKPSWYKQFTHLNFLKIRKFT